MATFLDRTTKQVRPDDGSGIARDGEIRNPDLLAVDGLPTWQWIVEGDVVRPPTTEELAALEAANLPQWRAERMAEIDARTAAIATSGCQIEPGVVLSTSITATQNLQNLVLGYQMGTVLLPQDVSTLDGGAYTITDGAAMLRVATAITAQQRSCLAAGRALRIACRSAASKAELEAITDDREVPTWPLVT